MRTPLLLESSVPIDLERFRCRKYFFFLRYLVYLYTPQIMAFFFFRPSIRSFHTLNGVERNHLHSSFFVY